ncbi:ankyrin repeat-containing domain protein [Mycena polygramma]|nr:ankyrin repeat-containing domain protein [Mycena polygramma]
MFPRQAELFSFWERGTGMWLLRHNRFQEWRSGTEKTLWCQGMPGAGKTVLASLVTDTFRVEVQDQNIGVAVIYLEHRETDVPPPSKLLAALWRQLVFGKLISPALEHLYSIHHEPETRPTLMEDDAVLRSIIVEYSKVFIIVDGLDEYSETQRDILLHYLWALGPSVKLLLTSRPHITIHHVIPSYKTLEIRATGDDIRKFLNGQISKSSRLSKHISNSPNLHQDLEATIVERSDGMFLLAKLHAESLAEKRNVKEIRGALNDMADDLDAAYGAVVDRINQQSLGDRRLAWRTLSWIAHAKRPLRRSELAEALALEPGAVSLDRENLPEMDIVVSVCAGLVVINKKDDVVRLIHYTTELFLRSPSVQAKAYPRAQGEITMTCITYLSLGFEAMADGLQQPVVLFTHNPFLHYAVDYCLVHARGEPELQIKPALLSFLSDCPVWRRLYSWKRGGRTLPADKLWIGAVFHLEATCRDIITEAGREREGFGALLQQATLCRATGVIRLLLENGFDLQTNERGYGSLALQEASRRGYVGIVSLLIEHNVNVNIDEPGQSATATQMAYFSEHKQSAPLLFESREQANSDAGCHSTSLCAAIEGGHEEVVRLLIEYGANINAGSGKALRVASKNGNIGVVRMLIGAGADVSANGCCALRAGSENGNTAVVKLLIAAGADVHAHGGQALCAASKNGNTEMIKLLIEAGADIDADGGYALFFASCNRNVKAVELLIAAGADVDAHGGYAWCAASWNGNVEVVKLFLEAGVDVDANGGEALRVASVSGDTEVVKLLIEAGADINANNGETLRAATKNGDTELVKLLMEAGGIVIGNIGQALGVALENGNAGVIKLLIEGSADADGSKTANAEIVTLLIEGGSDMKTNSSCALLAASRNGSAKLVELLIEAGADVNAGSGEALRVASRSGNAQVIKLLVQAGADVNSHGGWVLWAASGNGMVEVVKLLIEAGAGVNAYLGESLGVASRIGSAEIVKLLIEAGADVNANGGEALRVASSHGMTETVELLIASGADVNARGNALRAASRNGRIEVIKLLVAAGADVNLGDCWGWSALDAASENGNMEVVKLLIEAGSQVKGSVALRAASRAGNTEILKLLIEAGADVNGEPLRVASLDHGTPEIIELLIAAGAKTIGVK